MTASNWTRSKNFFTSHILESHQNGELIVNYTNDALLNNNTDVDILALYTFLNPYKASFSASYATWLSLKSGTPSNTMSISQLLDDLSSTQIRKWDVSIQMVHNNKTPQYKMLLPKHRIPFQTNTTANRVHALETLITNIGSEASLTSIKTEIITFLALLNTAITKQSDQLSTIDTAIESLEITGVAAAQALLFVYSSLLTKYYLTPSSIEKYFDVSELQNGVQNLFTRLLIDKIPKKLSKRKMNVLKGSLKCTNVGDTIVRLYYTNGINTAPTVDGAFIELQPNSESTHTFAEGGYTTDNHFLFVANTGVTNANVKIEIV